MSCAGRADFSRLFFIPLTALLVLSACAGRGLADRPHVLIYLSDDHSLFDTSLFGATDIPTPNMEKLAAAGMTFTHAFVASPSCAPSRAALLTGLMPARNGAEANHTFPREGTHWLIENIKAAGYETAAFGKVAHAKSAKRAGFEVIFPAPDVTRLRENVSKFLVNRKSDKPLCLCVGTSNPHVPWTAPSTFDPAQVVFPPKHLDTPATREHRAAYYQEIKELDELLGDLRQLAAEHLGENVLMLHTSDHGSQWPFGKWTLYDYGTRVPLFVAWPGVIKPGSKTDAMVSWVDLLPTVIDLIGGEVPADLDGRSFAAVLRGETDAHRDRIMTTHSGDGIKNIYPSRAIRTREWKFIHNLHPEFAFTNHSDLDRKPMAGAYWTEWAELAKTDPHAKKIVDLYYRRPEFELYHVSADRWEEQNLADDPKQAARIEKLKQELEAWMKSQGDQQTVFNQPHLLARPETWHPDHFTPPPPLDKPPQNPPQKPSKANSRQAQPGAK